MNSTPNKTPRILITRLSHIGDCVLTLPMVCAIKRAYPEAWIGWTLESPTQKLFRGHPCIDEIMVVEKGLASRPWKWKSVGRKLRSHQFDIAIDPQSLSKSSLLGWLSGAPTRIGFGKPYRRELARVFNNEFIDTKHTHLVDRTMDLLTHPSLAVKDTTVEYRLPQCPDEETAVRQFLDSKGLENYLVINPGASWDSKRWVTGRFSYVAKYASQAYGIPSVVTWAGDAEKQMAESIVRESDGDSVLAPKTSLGELAAVFRRATAMIGCDTGPLHIASASGCPCIGLHGPTLPTRSGAYGPRHIAVQRWYQGDRNRRRAENLAMQDITVDDVCQAVDQMMERIRFDVRAAA